MLSNSNYFYNVLNLVGQIFRNSLEYFVQVLCRRYCIDVIRRLEVKIMN